MAIRLATYGCILGPFQPTAPYKVSSNYGLLLSFPPVTCTILVQCAMSAAMMWTKEAKRAKTTHARTPCTREYAVPLVCCCALPSPRPLPCYDFEYLNIRILKEAKRAKTTHARTPCTRE
jgi:hypothetical protein